MKKNRHHDRHTNVLKPSILDTVEFSKAVQDRFLDLCGSYLRIRGVELDIPESLDPDFRRWRIMHLRHKQGDFRNTEAELTSLKEIATWTLQINAALRNQPPVKFVTREDVGL